MNSQELRQHFLNFFKERGHQVIPSASLVPENDSSVLFTSAGMQQFRRYYANPNEAPAVAITTCQKCIRTSDIDEVGDATHLTFFEMLGNFSFGYPEEEGSYFKKEAIEYAWEFLTEVLKIKKNRLSATYFKGEDDIPADGESLAIIKQVTGLSDDKITGTGKDETFWSLGTEGSPGGPTVEFYIDGVEIWNLVFNQYVMKDGKYIPSKLKGVDTGMGLERLTAMMQGKDDVFKTDLFSQIISEIEKISGKKYPDNKKAFRIIADHIKAAVLLISEDIFPSNKDQGYIVRRLIRRTIVQANGIGVTENFISKIADVVFKMYRNLYLSVIPTLFPVIPTDLPAGKAGVEGSIRQTQDRSIQQISRQARDDTKEDTSEVSEGTSKVGLDSFEVVIRELEKEESKFRKTLISGLKIIEAQKDWTSEQLFNLYQTYGIPLEIALEEIRKVWGGVDYKISVADEVKIKDEFQIELKKHQEKSRTASAGMFKGGLADAGEETTKLHTAAHLLLAALREIYGPETNQKGSNITAERLRFDFNHAEKMTPKEIKKVEDIVNENIKADLPVTMEEMSVKEAKESGATGVFDDRYGDRVKVYTIGTVPSTHEIRSGSRDFVSREICGGPHIEHTSQLGHFKITKEESSSAGIRRIKAVLE